MEKNRLTLPTAKTHSKGLHFDVPPSSSSSSALLLSQLRSIEAQKPAQMPVLRPLGDKTNYVAQEQVTQKSVWSNASTFMPPSLTPPVAAPWRMPEAPKRDSTGLDPLGASQLFTPQYSDKVDSIKFPSIHDSQPSRHLCISNLEPHQDTRSLVQVLEQAGDMKAVHPDFFYSSGTLVVSYYDLRHAARGYTDLRAFVHRHSLHRIQITFATDAKVARMFNTNVQNQDSVFVALYGAVERLETFNFMGLLESFGTIRNVMDIEFSSGRKVALVEFQDERVAARVQAHLHDKIFQDVTVQIRPCTTQPTADVPPEAPLPSIEHGWHSHRDPPSPGSLTFSQSSMDVVGEMSRSRTPSVPLLVSSSTSTSTRFSTIVGHPVAMDVDTNKTCSCRDSPPPASPPAFDTTGAFGYSNSLFANDPLLAIPLYSDRAVQPQASTTSSLRQQSPALMNKHAAMETDVTSMSVFDRETCGGGTGDSSATLMSPIDGADASDNTFDIDRVIQGKDLRTTFMIRNIPNKYTQQMLIECINATHKGTYDFLYLRIDFKNKCNVGYAFINFINVHSVISFAQERVGRRWNRFNSEKRCSLSYANIQGKEALIEKFRNSNVMEEDETYRPKVFCSSGPAQGYEEPFPSPTISAETRKQRQHLRQRRDGTSRTTGNSTLKLCR